MDVTEMFEVNETKKQITKTKYLTALGLMHIAKTAVGKAEECEKAIGKLLGINGSFGSCGHVSDEIWGGSGNLDLALEREEIMVKE